MGAMMGGGRGPGAGGGQGAPPQGQPAGGAGQQPGNRPAGAGGPAGPGGPGGPGGRPGGGFNIQDVLERLPIIHIADLKVGDTIIVSSTKGADPTRLTAIAIVAALTRCLRSWPPAQPGWRRGGANAGGGLGGSGITFGIGLP